MAPCSSPTSAHDGGTDHDGPTPAARTTESVVTTAFAVEITVVTDIAAPASDVWAILADTARYPEWNPQITSFDGALAVGERVAVTLQLPGRTAQRMRPRITAVEPGRRFEWLGSIGVRGLFDGRHAFTVEATGPATSRFTHHERLAGALVPLFRSMLTGPTPAAFVALNTALAARAERAGEHGGDTGA